ncbi:hypothetical protein SLA2020_121430 [Shorea laevis]
MKQRKVVLVTRGDFDIGRTMCIYFAKEWSTVAFMHVKGHNYYDMDETLQMLIEAKTPNSQVPMAVVANIGYKEYCNRVINKVVHEYG